MLAKMRFERGSSRDTVRRVSFESQILGYGSLAETVMVRFEFFSTCVCLLTRRCAIPGRVFHPVPPIEVACTSKPCGQ